MCLLQYILQHMNLENLDKALHDLGMLSAITEARRDYLSETKTNYGVMRLNTRYVSNVTVGYRMKKVPNKNRPCPYVLRIRARTKSENSDVTGIGENEDCSLDFKKHLLEPSTSGSKDIRDTVSNSLKYSTKRCQSLENLKLSIESQQGLDTSPEMECVSMRIQKLHVDE